MMETANFLTWFFFILSVAGAGIGIMTYAYQGKGSISVLFPDPVPLPNSLPDSGVETEATLQFQDGCSKFQAGDYRRAIESFTRALQQLETLAEAYHNRGLAYANLRKDDDSVINLLKASELYSQQDQGENLRVLKQHLQAIKSRKR
ncbi:MAG: tetratricopeptide repeat protein [Microcoleaceae cyanobacterium]